MNNLKITDPALLLTIFENFNTQFKANFFITADTFLSDHPKYHEDDRRYVVLLIVSLSLAFTICTQREEDYIRYFEAVGNLSEDHADEVKLFLNVLIKEVENRGMIVDEGQKVSSSRKIIFGFEDKINEYEDKIIELTNGLSAANREVKQLSTANKTLTKRNKELKNEVEHLKVAISKVSDKNTREKEEEFKNREANFKKEIKNLRKKIEDGELEKEALQNKLHKVKLKKRALKEENLSHTKALSDISENYIDKDVHDKQLKEKMKMEQKLLEMENNYVLEISETKSLKSTISKQEREIKQYQKKDKEYNERLNTLRTQTRNPDSNIFSTNNLIKSNFTNPVKNRRERNHTLDPSGLLKDDYSGSDFDFDSRPGFRNQPQNINKIHDNIEQLNKKLEQLKVSKNVENRELEKTVKQLMEEIKQLKRKGNQKDSHFVTNKTHSRLKSRDLSAIRKNPEMSDELVQKIIGMEKKIKELKNENTYLHQSIVKNLSGYKYQMDVLYSTIRGYVNNSV